jgi:16S rRNA (adenine1518-N6/adenine1519-N6)-dimethyltransferase
MELCDLKDIRALLARHGFHFSKAMGQNFLIDPSVPRAIAESCGADEDCAVLEIGPGIGCLTEQLARRAGKVVAVELDARLLPVLEETMADFDNVEILHGDILKLSLSDLAAEQFAGCRALVCANLPYNITTPVLSALLDSGCFSGLTVMVQKEVAQRICAAPGTADYGAFSVYMQFYTAPEILFDVPPESFMPAPKVTSAVLRCPVRETAPVNVSDVPFFFRVVRAAFALRRKTLLNCLAAAFGSQLSKGDLAAVIEECGFSPAVRGETLGLAEFSVLSNALYHRLQG